MRRAVQFGLDALPQGGADAAEGGSHPGFTLTESVSDFTGGFGEGIFSLQKESLLFRKACETFFKDGNQRHFWSELSFHSLLHEMVLEKLFPVFGETLVSQGLLANEIERDRPEPLAEIRARPEVMDVTMRKDECLVGDFIDEMWHGKFHRHEGTKMGSMKIEQPLKRGKIATLNTDDEILLILRSADLPF